MKTIISLSALTLILTAFMPNTTILEKKKTIGTSVQMAEHVMTALKKSSSAEYVSLFPSLADFQDMMKQSSEIYGSYLPEAQREFATRYEDKLVPAVKESFEGLIREGKEKGIEWNRVKYIGTETGEQSRGRFAPVPVTIIFSANGVEHKIIIERALVIDGQWKVSQFLKLI